jgi:hypothetical protein
MGSKCFYCHFEERKRPASDFDMIEVYSPLKYRGGKHIYKDFDKKAVPRAICNECLKKGRSLARKYDFAGYTKPEYTEFGKFRG